MITWYANIEKLRMEGEHELPLNKKIRIPRSRNFTVFKAGKSRVEIVLTIYRIGTIILLLLICYFVILLLLSFAI